MDPLSDVLSLLKLRSYVSAGFDGGGDWSVAVGRYDGIKFHAVISGECWLSVEGIPDAIRLRGGDCLLLPRGRPFRVGSDLTLPPADARTLIPSVQNGGITVFNGGGDFFAVGGYFALTGPHAGVLLEALPPVVHIRKASDKAALHWCIEQMRQELREPQPGGFLVAQQLATMILLQALRLHLAEGLKSGVGWLFALTDRQMSAAMSAVHADPGDRWTVRAMAERAGMSRTVFALKFRKMVGMSPMEYLTRWRMLRAGSRLLSSSDPISVIALSLGYESESAFSTAFKRVMGCSPRQYANGRHPGSLSRNEPEPAHATLAELRAAMETGAAAGS